MKQQQPVLGLVQLLVLSSLIIGSLALAACSPEPEPTPTPTPSPTATSTPTKLAKATPQSAVFPQNGDTVSVHYRGTLDSGEEFDSSEGREPLTFTVGSHQVIKGFEKAVTTLEVGHSVTVHISAADAYGERLEDRVFTVARDLVPTNVVIGETLMTPNGMTAQVLSITDDTVQLDTNHALAGKPLNFRITLLAIN
ncbi:MAG: FKBP-type peptidyl-prolyl cis-trans isomerase [Chloroflexota bacterium]|nr:FKBP-type peptidyl-prolyl cis-trans isomerase [Chloroflexota bacterium]